MHAAAPSPPLAPLSSAACAMREGRTDAERAALARYLDATPGASVKRFSPRDDDELGRALCEGGYGRVVFATLDAFLETMWKGHADVDRWAAAGVRIEIADAPAADDAALDALLRTAATSYARWRREQRRRQTIAAAILSVAVLVAMAVLFLLVPPAK